MTHDGQQSDSDRLRAIYEQRCGNLTQEEFGKLHKIGSQGMVWQYLNGRAPLNIKVAKKFATALEVPVADFSQALAKKIEEENEVVRVPVNILLPTNLRGDMLSILAERSRGAGRVKLYEIYEEAIREYVERHGIATPKDGSL